MVAGAPASPTAASVTQSAAASAVPLDTTGCFRPVSRKAATTTTALVAMVTPSADRW